MTRPKSESRIPCPLCGKSDRVIRDAESWRCQRCKRQYQDTVSGPLRIGYARAVYGRGPRDNLIATIPTDILAEFNELVGVDNVGSGKHRSAVLALALELLLAVLARKNTWRVARNLETLSVEPRETRMNLTELVRHLAERNK